VRSGGAQRGDPLPCLDDGRARAEQQRLTLWPGNRVIDRLSGARDQPFDFGSD
jgi:hypothetical protein